MVNDITAPSVIIVEPIRTVFGINETVPITVNVTDLYYNNINSVNANVSWSSGSQIVTLTYNVTSELYEGTFSPSATGSHTIRIIADDNGANINNTETRAISIVLDAIPPTINSLEYTPHTSMILVGNHFNLTANITDNIEIDKAYTNIALPNGTIITGGLTFNYSAPLAGLYNVTLFANDTSGNSVTQIIYFLAGNDLILNQYNLVNQSEGIPGTVTVYYIYPPVYLHNHTFTNGIFVDEHIADALIDYEYIAASGHAKIILRRLNLTVDNNKTLGYSELGNSLTGFLDAIGINSTYISMSYATIIYNYSEIGYGNENNLEVYVCHNWNFTIDDCIDNNWTLLDVDQNITAKTFTFNVSNFSAFAIEETTIIPHAGGGGGGLCLANWECSDWSACSDSGFQTRTCIKSNANCITLISMPETVRACGISDEGPLERIISIIIPSIEKPGSESQKCCIFGICWFRFIVCWYIWIIIIILILLALLIRKKYKDLTKGSLIITKHKGKEIKPLNGYKLLDASGANVKRAEPTKAQIHKEVKAVQAGLKEAPILHESNLVNGIKLYYNSIEEAVPISNMKNHENNAKILKAPVTNRHVEKRAEAPNFTPKKIQLASSKKALIKKLRDIFK